ncbi:MAG: hypothetical protein WC516_09090 [Patescibacteria group bacterium]|jgi:hypothetical protein
MKCVECGKDATYDAPDHFCDFHWHLWLYSRVFDDLTPEEFEQCEPSEDERLWFRVVQTGARVKSKGK